MMKLEFEFKYKKKCNVAKTGKDVRGLCIYIYDGNIKEKLQHECLASIMQLPAGLNSLLVRVLLLLLLYERY